MDVLAHHPDSIDLQRELRRHIAQLQISRHMQNWFGMCRAVAVFLEAHLDGGVARLRNAISHNVEANAWRQVIPLLLTGIYLSTREFGASVTPRRTRSEF